MHLSWLCHIGISNQIRFLKHYVCINVIRNNQIITVLISDQTLSGYKIKKTMLIRNKIKKTIKI